MKQKYNVSLDDIHLELQKIKKTLQYLVDNSNLPSKAEYQTGRAEMLKSLDKMYKEAEIRRNT